MNMEVHGSITSRLGAGLHAGNSLNEVFLSICKALPMFGVETDRRGSKVLEFRGPQLIEISNPHRNMMMVQGRNINPWVTLAEFPWIMAGRDDISWLTHYLPRASNFSDNGTTWRAAYGPRIRNWYGNVDQIDQVIKTLKADRASRQAVVVLWDPEEDWQVSGDIPCTNWMHFQVVGNKLDLLVGMRSNDLIWGFSGVNVFNFTMLQQLVAAAVGVEVGVYRHLSSNLHVYERHYDLLEIVNSALDNEEFYDSIAVPTMNFFDFESLDSFTEECEEALEHVKANRVLDWRSAEGLVCAHSWLTDWVSFMLVHELKNTAARPEELVTALNRISRLDWRAAAASYLIARYIRNGWLEERGIATVIENVAVYSPLPAPGMR